MKSSPWFIGQLDAYFAIKANRLFECNNQEACPCFFLLIN